MDKGMGNGQEESVLLVIAGEGRVKSKSENRGGGPRLTFRGEVEDFEAGEIQS